jgi:adenine-specific DNA-methyltransferase
MKNPLANRIAPQQNDSHCNICAQISRKGRRVGSPPSVEPWKDEPPMAKKPVETEVENYRHDAAKRLNIPTAENQSLVPDDEKALKVLRYPRNPDLDPQLVWRGKDAEDGAPLEVAAPPIYIQEKIHPQALIEDLRRQSARRKNERAEQTDLFHDFNGLPEGWVEDAAASYYHDEGRWQNRMILGDSLLVIGSLAEREVLRGKVQCIYSTHPIGPSYLPI